MAAGEELGVGYVTLTVSTKGLGKEIAGKFRDAEKQAKTTGTRMGKVLSETFNRSVDLDSLATEIKIAEERGTRAVQEAAAAQAKARERAQDAAAKQAVEERRLAAVRLKAENAAKEAAAAEDTYQRALRESKDESKDAERAAQSLDRAREKAATAAASLAAAEDKVNRAKRESVRTDNDAATATKRVQDAQEELARELGRTQKAYDEAARRAKRGGEDAKDGYVSGWRGLSRTLGRTIQTAVNRAVDSADVVRKGFVQGRAYGESFKAGMASVKQSSPANAIGMLSGARVMADMGSHFGNMVTNMDRALPKLSLMATAIAALGGAGLAGVQGILGVAAGLGSIAAVGLTLPGVIAGAVGGFAILGMALADVKDVLGDLGPAFQNLQKHVSANFWAQAAQPIRDLAQNVLPILNTGLGAAATEMGRWVYAIANVMNSVEGLGFISASLDYLTTAIDIAGDGVGAMAGAFLQLGTVGMSYLPNLAGWFNAIAYSFQDWVAQAVASGDIFDWIDAGIANLKALGGVLFHTVGIFHALGQAAYDAGSGGLIGLAEGMARVDAAMHSPVFQGALVTVFKGANDAMDGLGRGVSALGGAFVSLAPTIASVLGIAGDAFGTLLEGLSAILSHPVFQQGLVDFFTGIRGGVEALTPAFDVLGEKFGMLASFAGTLAQNLGTVLGGAIVALAPPFTTLMEAVQPLIPKLGEIVVALIQGIAPVVNVVAAVLGTLIGIIVNVISWFAQFHGVLQVVGGVLATVAAAFGAIIGGLWLVSTVVQVVTGVVNTFKIAWGLLQIVMSLNPFVLIATAVAGLIVAIIAAYNNIGWFKDGVNAVWDAIKFAASSVVTWFQTVLVPMFQAALSAVGAVFMWLWTNIAQPVWGWIQGIVSGFVTWLTVTAVPWIQSAMAAVGDVFTWLYVNIVQPIWTGILIFITAVVAALMTIWQGIVWTFQNFVAPVFTWFYSAVIVPVWNAIRNFIASVWTAIRDNILTPLVNFVRGPVTSAWLWISSVVSQVWTAIRNAVSSAWNWIRSAVLVPLIGFVRGALTFAWQWLSSIVSQVWTAIRNTVANTWNWIRNAILSPAIGFIRNVFGLAWSWLRDRVSSVWGGIRDASSAAWAFVRDRVFAPFRSGLDLLETAFTRTKDGIKAAWDKLRGAVKEPISFVVNSVVNPFLVNYNKVNDFWGGDDIGTIKGFARGGVLPGYQSRKRDDVLTPMRSGEGVLVPEVVKGIGGAATINALNAAGNAGGVGAVRNLWHSGKLRSAERTASAEQEHGMYAAGPAGAGPHGGLWGAIQTQMNRTGKLYVPNTVVQGRNIAEAAKAWMGQSALDIIAGNGSPSISAGVGHRGPWGFADTSGKVEISTTTPANRVVGTMVHELGHILSLQHSGDGSYGDTSSVMSAGMSGGDWPHSIDYRVLRRVWGEPGKGVTRYSASDVEGVTASSLNPMDWISDKLDPFVTGPIKAAKDKFAKNKFVQMGTGLAGKMFDGIKQKAADLLSKLPGFGDAIEGGKKVFNGVANKAKLTAWMTEALKKKGLLNPGNLASGIARALKESGGDPNIVQQIQDVNSGGNEARGLMQVTPTTFRANMEPGHGNIFDPVDNILASINYTLKRYGSVRGGWDQPGGYALGGVVEHARSITGGMVGGIRGMLSGVWDAPVGSVQTLRPGVNTIYNGTGSNEYFERVSSVEDRSNSGNEFHQHFHGQQWEPEQVVRRGTEQMASTLRKAGIRV